MKNKCLHDWRKLIYMKEFKTCVKCGEKRKDMRYSKIKQEQPTERYTEIEISEIFRKYKVVSMIDWLINIEKRLKKLKKSSKIR